MQYWLYPLFNVCFVGLLGDEEDAYIYFFKYVECVKAINKHPEYKKDEKYYQSMHNIKKNSKTAISALEKLSESLQERYADDIEEKIQINGEVDNSLDENCNNKRKNLEKEKVEDSVKPVEKKDVITVHKLHSLIKERSTTFFILDTRFEKVLNKF